jgi:hypothetical protein
MLKRLVLVGCNFDDLPPEVCGESYSRLRGEPFDENNVFSTYGIRLNDMPLSLEGLPEPVRLNF